MFATVDALNHGKYFLTSLFKARPLPFSFEVVDAAVLLSTSGQNGSELAIVLVKQDSGDGEGRVIVQICDVTKNEILLFANFTIEYDFISASAQGIGVDEVDAVDLLMGYVPLIEGEWSQVEAPLQLVGEEQNDGSRSEAGSVA